MHILLDCALNALAASPCLEHEQVADCWHFATKLTHHVHMCGGLTGPCSCQEAVPAPMEIELWSENFCRSSSSCPNACQHLLLQQVVGAAALLTEQATHHPQLIHLSGVSCFTSGVTTFDQLSPVLASTECAIQRSRKAKRLMNVM